MPLLFVLTFSILRAPLDLAFAAAGFTHSNATPVAIGILWRELMSTLAVSETPKVMVLSFRKGCFPYMSCMIKQLKMTWIAALRSAASMVNLKSCWYRRYQKLVNDSMHIDLPFVYAPNSVTSDRSISSPEPTTRWADKNTSLHALRKSAQSLVIHKSLPVWLNGCTGTIFLEAT
jgi:hypothetical protein